MNEVKASLLRGIVLNYVRNAEKQAILKDLADFLSESSFVVNEQLCIREKELSKFRGVRDVTDRRDNLNSSRNVLITGYNCGRIAKPIKEEMYTFLIQGWRSELVNFEMEESRIMQKYDAAAVELRLLDKEFAKLNAGQFEICLEIVGEIMDEYETLVIGKDLVSGRNRITKQKLLDRMRASRLEHQLTTFKQEEICIKPEVPPRRRSTENPEQSHASNNYLSHAYCEVKPGVRFVDKNQKVLSARSEPLPCVFEPGANRQDYVQMDIGSDGPRNLK